MRTAKDPLVIDVGTSESESEEEKAAKQDQRRTSVFYECDTATKNTIPSDASELLACRVCLSTDVKLYNLYECKLDESFADFTGIPMYQQDGLPQHLCYWCQALLRKSAAFRDRCQSTHYYLLNIYTATFQLTTQDIRCLDKKKFTLPLTETQPLTLSYSEADVTSQKELPEFKDFKTHPKFSKIEIDVEPLSECVPDNKTDSDFITTHVMVKIEDTSLDNAEAFSDNDNSTETEPIDNDKEMEKNSSSVSNKSRIRRIASKSKDLEKFSAAYNVDIVHVSVKEQLEEMHLKRNSSSFKNSEYKCELCCMLYRDAMACANHRKRHDPSRGNLECEICGLRFMNTKNLSRHIQTTHKPLRFKCRFCGCVTKHTRAAITHYKMHKSKKKAYHCSDCPKRFSTGWFFAAHVQKYHAAQRCGECGDSFAGTKALADHKIVHEQAHKCSSCDVGFRNSDALDKHECGKRSCTTCGEGFESKEQLKKHRVEVHQSKKCAECGFTCSSLKKLDQHYLSDHKGKKRPGKRKRLSWGDKDRMCDVCATTVKSRNYRAHMRKHSNEKPHQCRFCEKRFPMKWHLREHEYKHTGERPLKCSECPATFRRYVEKTEHKKKVHLNKMYQCRTCRVCLVSQSNLEAHELKHLKNMPFQCDLCKNCFVSKLALETHISNHGQHRSKQDGTQKKYLYKCNLCPERFPNNLRAHKHRAEVHNVSITNQCDICGKVFLMKTLLLSHMKTHSNIKEQSYKCMLCPKVYSRKSCLTEHMNIHTGAKPYKCSLCPETFGGHWKRYEHRMRVHLKKPIRKRRLQAPYSDDE